MTNGNERLLYNLYLDSTHKRVWGDGSNGTDYYMDAHPPNQRSVTVPVYGRIPPLQDAAEGEYIDVLQVKVLF